MKNGNIKISVIIPVYNVEEYLMECLDSVINQSMKEIEIICIDDASTDNSVNILEYYRDIDNRISIYCNKSNSGAASTRNRGIRKARGKYIYALDADDKIKSDALCKLYEVAEKESCDVVVFEGELIFQNARLEKKFNDYTICRRGNYPQLASGKTFFSLFIKSNEWVVSVPRHFYRKDFIDSNGLQFVSGIVEEDELFSFQVYMYARKIIYIREQLFVRRFRENSVVTNPDIEKVFTGKFVTFMQVMKYQMKEEENRDYKKAVEKYSNILCRSLLDLYSRLDESARNRIKIENKDFKLSYCIFRHITDVKKLSIEHEYNMEVIFSLRNKEINIFGAGKKAKAAIPVLLENDVRIKKIIVSASKDNVPYVYGIEVSETNGAEEDQLTPIAICLAGREDVKNILLKRGFKNIVDIYR